MLTFEIEDGSNDSRTASLVQDVRWKDRLCRRILIVAGVAVVLFICLHMLDQDNEGQNLVTENVNTPQEFVDALQAVIRTKSCEKKKYSVSTNLYGTLQTFHEKITHLANPPSPDRARNIAWISSHSTLKRMLNDNVEGCCSADMTPEKCKCRIARNVGIIKSVDDCASAHQNMYVVLEGTTGGTLTGERDGSATGPIVALEPKWAEMLDLVRTTYSPDAPLDCDMSAVGRELEEKSYDELVAANQDVLLRYGVEKPSDHCWVNSDKSDLFRVERDQMCNNAMVVRLYMCTFLGANPLFKGKGTTSGGLLEYIALNPPISRVVSAHGACVRFPEASETAFPACSLE